MRQRGSDLVRWPLRLFSQISLTKRFAFLSFFILLAGMLIIGWWVTREIESGVMNRTASVTASFVTSFVSPHLQNLGETGEVSRERMETLDRLLFDTELGQRIVSFKVWAPDGRILYSPKRELIGKAFGVRPSFQKVLTGETVSHISDLSDAENEYERQFFTTLQETYTPLRELGSGEITGIVEFYEKTEVLTAAIQAARFRSWFIVGIATVAMYFILLGMVKGASLTIGRQRRQLENRVTELRKALSENQALNSQLRAVTAVATAANEIRDQEAMLSRCLEVVLEQTRMDAVAVRLLDGTGSQLAVVGAQGDFSGFPCRYQTVGLGECPCGVVASNGVPLYLSPQDQTTFQPSCRMPLSRATAILPLKSAKGAIGVLYLSRKKGDVPGPQERETLDAICNQIATALENARLLQELARVEAQREMDRLKAEFISAISHELRTPLGFIKGYATTLLRDDITVDQTVQREFLQIIDQESDKLQRMIEDLLDASRIQAGRLQLDRKSVSLRELLERAAHKAHPSLDNRGYALVVHPIEDDAEVLGDPLRIEQVVLNLVENAAQYSDPGCRIDIEAVAQDRHVVVRVRDQGDGIPPQEVERIFEPFYRGTNARRRGTPGTGLGLAICKGIIESHGGKFWVENNPEKGSTFFFTLPLAALDASETVHQTSALENSAKEEV